MKETDLYPPVKRYLEAQGYEVKAEVLDCDVLAIRGDEAPVVVELKLSLNLDVVLQGIDRLKVAPTVYIGVYGNGRRLGSMQRKRIVKLVRMLGLGLIAIWPSRDRVEVLVDPGPYTPRISKGRQARLLLEFEKRVGDPNAGGASRRRGIMTAYRQRALEIAKFLRHAGPTRAATVASTLGEPTARDIMYRDVYGWFDRTGVGIYELSPRGRKEIETWDA